MDQAKLYETQISFTEWFERIHHDQTATMREEDNEKRERLKILHDLIQLPFDQPTQFLATEIVQNSPQFQKFLQERGHEYCALRLIPLRADLPKLRLRGKTIREVLSWFSQQKIDPAHYKADFVPHAEDYHWSTIFVVNKQGIFGEIILGGHYQLTQGFYDEHKPIFFSYDFKNWKLSEENQEAMEHLQEIISKLLIPTAQLQQALQKQLAATFSQDYLCGYFETVSSFSRGLWFVDYNRILGKMYDDFVLPEVHFAAQNHMLKGMSANKGKALGRVHIITADNLQKIVFQQGEILVCDITTPDFVPLMQRAAAIVTDRGGILSHAAIVSRELKIPCITGVGDGTKKLKDGDVVEVDADNGIINILK